MFTQTFTGREIYLDKISAEDIDVCDIAHALSNICRFHGNTRDFYSVAQHSVLVSQIVPEDVYLWGLIHDAPEAYIGDMPSIIKHSSMINDEYFNMEDRIMSVIAKSLGLAGDVPRHVKDADWIVLSAETRDLFGGRIAHLCNHIGNSIVSKINPLQPYLAEELFLERFYEITVCNGGGARG